MRTLDRQIHRRQRIVGLESEGSSVADTFAQVYNVKMFGDIKERLSELFKLSTNHRFATTTNLDRKVAMWMDKTSYMVLGDISVYTPKGMKVPYLQYVEALEATLPFINDLKEGLIVPTTRALGVLINNPSTLAAKSGLPGDTFKTQYVKIDLEDYAQKIGDCFDKDDSSDTLLYKDAVKRNKDYDDVVGRVQRIQDGLNMHSPTELQQATEDLYDLASKLGGEIAEGDLYDGMSKKVSKQLSEQLYACALWVEFYAVYRRQVLVLSQALEDTNNKMKKLAKGK